MPTLQQYRADLREISRLAIIDLDSLWPLATDEAAAYALLLDALPELVDVYGSAAATAAADWYDELRIESGAAGAFRAAPAALPTLERYESLAGWATEPMRQGDPESALARATGGLQRTITNASRDTITGASIADPAARGWRRVVSSDACGFCRMLAARGAVFTTGSVDFGAHDHCSCVAAPAFGGDTRLARDYAPSTRNISAAERARTRAWMREHGY